MNINTEQALREALRRIKSEAVSLADAQVLALEALTLPTAAPVDEREAFEALFRERYGWDAKDFKRDSRGDYMDGNTVTAWVSWQARAALQSSVDERPDMFWNNDDPEKQFDSIDEMLNDLWNQGAEPEVGSVFEVQRGIRLPNIKVIVTSVDENAGEFEYEEIDAAIRARPEGGV